jgi:ubiquinone/menaquinone biosynthesis C-methylase UbiE
MSEWNGILREKVYRPEEPDEHVIRFAVRLKRRRALRILDLGCGAGRHLIYMAKQGFQAFGADFSESGLKMAKKRLGKEKLRASLVRCDMKMLPFVGLSFDVVICTRAIYHQKIAAIQDTISEVHRALGKNGLLLMDFLSKRTYSYGRGMRVEANTFVEGEGFEKGVVHHFTGGEELKVLFRDFKITNMELRERVVESKLRSCWIVTAMVQMNSNLGS